jgi:uncharacterized protein (DUF433 family)
MVGEIISESWATSIGIRNYPYLAREDVVEALRYAAWRAEEREVNLQRAS